MTLSFMLSFFLDAVLALCPSFQGGNLRWQGGWGEGGDGGWGPVGRLMLEGMEEVPSSLL